MSPENLLFLGMRVLHVLLAGLWLGAVFFITMLLLPAAGQAGPAGGQVMTALVRRGLPAVMAAIGGMVLVTGFYLFWRFTGGFDPIVSASRAGMAYSIGALAGLVGLIIGGSVIGRGTKKMVALDEQAAKMPENQRGAIMSEIGALQARIGTSSRILLVLLLIAMATMTLGHYI